MTRSTSASAADSGGRVTLRLRAASPMAPWKQAHQPAAALVAAPGGAGRRSIRTRRSVSAPVASRPGFGGGDSLSLSPFQPLPAQTGLLARVGL